MTVLSKPTPDVVADPEQLLTMLVKFWQVLSAQQATSSAIVNLGAVAADPPVPPKGTVYEYVLGGSFKVRTATNIYTVAA